MLLPCGLANPLDLAGLRGGLARILEKQNRFQMSQVFPFRASMIKWALLFKDSMSGTEEWIKLPDSHTIVNARTDPKASAARLEELPGLLPLANFGPA